MPNSRLQPDKHSTSPKRCWAFFTYAYNYGDCSRAIEIAKQMKRSGISVKFFHRGGRFVDKISDAGLHPVGLTPVITPEQDEILMAIDQHRARIGTPLPFSEQQLTAMVESDLEMFRACDPVGVYCGLNLSTLISAPYARIPMVTCIPTALCPTYFQKNMASFPNAMETNFLTRHVLPNWFKNKLINSIMLGDSAKRSAVIFNQVRAHYGLPPICNYPSLVRGDLTLLPDLPQLSGLSEKDLPDGYHYTGPLFSFLDLSIPEGVRRVFRRDGLKIFCSMGSSGSPALLKLIVNILRGVPEFNVVCATTSILEPSELGPQTDNFFSTRFLPAHLVNELADIAVIHGGAGTVQTAAWSGTPVVGIGMQWEQQANLDGLVRIGMGIRIPLHSVSKKTLLNGIEVAQRSAFREKAQEMRRLVRSCNGAEEAVRQMIAFVR